MVPAQCLAGPSRWLLVEQVCCVLSARPCGGELACPNPQEGEKLSHRVTVGPPHSPDMTKVCHLPNSGHSHEHQDAASVPPRSWPQRGLTLLTRDTATCWGTGLSSLLDEDLVLSCILGLASQCPPGPSSWVNFSRHEPSPGPILPLRSHTWADTGRRCPSAPPCAHWSRPFQGLI